MKMIVSTTVRVTVKITILVTSRMITAKEDEPRIHQQLMKQRYISSGIQIVRIYTIQD